MCTRLSSTIFIIGVSQNLLYSIISCQMHLIYTNNIFLALLYALFADMLMTTFMFSKHVMLSQVLATWFDWNSTNAVMLNTYGAVSSNDHIAGIEEVVRDQNGAFIAGLAANIGKASNITAELWAIQDGLVLAKSLNLKEIHIETYSKVVFGTIRGITSSSSSANEHSSSSG